MAMTTHNLPIDAAGKWSLGLIAFVLLGTGILCGLEIRFPGGHPPILFLAILFGVAGFLLLGPIAVMLGIRSLRRPHTGRSTLVRAAVVVGLIGIVASLATLGPMWGGFFFD